MTAADRVRVWRERRVARGQCVTCGRLSDYGYYCHQCSRARAGAIQGSMRALRAARDFLSIWRLLAENRCITCGEAKDRFHPWRHRQCQRRIA